MCISSAGAGIVPEPFEQIRVDCRPCGGKAANRARNNGEQQREDRNPGIKRNRTDARQGIGQQPGCGPDDRGGKREAQQTACETEQKALAQGFTEHTSRTCTKSESYGECAATAQRTYQHQHRDIEAGDQQNHRNRNEKRPQQGPGGSCNELAQRSNFALDPYPRQGRRKVAHHLLRDPIGILRRLQ